MNKKENSAVIKMDEMKAAIIKSGYLMELDVTSVLTEAGFVTYMNDTYIDPDTGKHREIDISASLTGIIDESSLDSISARLFIECENNKQPIVLFKDQSSSSIFMIDRSYDINILGNPSTIHVEDRSMSFHHFTDLLNNHHYSFINPSTQYCTFHLPKANKANWIASHSDKQHNTIHSLLIYLEQNISQDKEYYTNTQLGKGGLNAYIDLVMYLPLIILGGPLYEASFNDSELKLEAKNHLQIKVERKINKVSRTDHIDIITRSYLDTYLKYVHDEVEYLLKFIDDNLDIFRSSAKKNSAINSNEKLP